MFVTRKEETDPRFQNFLTEIISSVLKEIISSKLKKNYETDNNKEQFANLIEVLSGFISSKKSNTTYVDYKPPVNVDASNNKILGEFFNVDSNKAPYKTPKINLINLKNKTEEIFVHDDNDDDDDDDDDSDDSDDDDDNNDDNDDNDDINTADFI